MLGITVFPEYIQSEGVEPLLDNLMNRAPVSAVSISPYTMRECPAVQGGHREPPADADKGLTRLLERPLWGKKEVWIKTAPSFEPNLELYQGLRYQPSKGDASTKKEGHIIDQFIEAAQSRRIKVYFQIQSAIPPGYRVQFGGPIGDDISLLPDGSRPGNCLDNNGSIASPHILGYGEALIKDLIQQYPKIDGVRIDWPEFPPYFFESIFTDFGPHVESFAKEHGFDFQSIRESSDSQYRFFLQALNNDHLKEYVKTPEKLITDLQVSPDRARLKSQIVTNLLLRYRNALDSVGGNEKELIPSAFPIPWNRLSGFDYQSNGEIANAISCKYYTMHWPMMLKNYTETLTRNNPGLSKSLLAESLCVAFEAVSPNPESSDSFHYPEPEENHPVSTVALGKKQVQVEAESTNAPIWPIAHSYGPCNDFAKRAKAVFSVSKKRLWINRYAYLTDEKLDALGEVVRSSEVE